MHTEPYFQKWFPAAEFRARHQRVYEAIGADSVALIQGAAPVGGFEVFRQTNELFHLTGLEVPQCYLLLNGGTRKSKLFLPRRDAQHASKDGEELAADDADLLIRLTGVDEVLELKELEAELKHASVIYTPQNPAEGNMACQDTLRQAAKLIAADPRDNPRSREGFFVDLLKSRFPSVQIRDLSPVLNSMRAVKSPAEIELMRFTGKLTAIAVAEAMRSTRPGIYEYELGAIAEYIYRLRTAAAAPVTARSLPPATISGPFTTIAIIAPSARVISC